MTRFVLTLEVLVCCSVLSRVFCQLRDGQSPSLKTRGFYDLIPAKKPSRKVDIVEPDFYPDPKPADLDPNVLRKILGKESNSEYVAESKEDVLLKKQNESRELVHREHQIFRKLLVNSMPKQIKQLDFTMPGLRKSLGPRASRKLQLWLWKMSFCPVISKWKYFGVRYWPPWRNVGRCAKKPSCSFPKGMRCKKAETKDVAALRWICLRKPKLTCRWVKIYLAVITTCRCTCHKGKDER